MRVMGSRIAPRLLAATLLIAVAALIVLLLGGRLDLALIALVGGVAAALIAIGVREERDGPAPAPTSDADTLVRELLDAIVEPVMLVRGGIVTFANRAARALLGQHIVGEDVRVAIRHPAAAHRLGMGTSAPVTDRPVELVGLGTPDQRWEMRTGETSDGARIIHLIDQTGNYSAERMRVDFVANASHELRTPLASILRSRLVMIRSREAMA